MGIIGYSLPKVMDALDEISTSLKETGEEMGEAARHGKMPSNASLQTWKRVLDGALRDINELLG